MDVKLEILIETICLLCLIILCILVFINGRSLNCDNCTLKTYQNRISGVELNEPVIREHKINDLYNGLLEGNCILKWDKHVGYTD